MYYGVSHTYLSLKLAMKKSELFKRTISQIALDLVVDEEHTENFFITKQ